MRTDGLKDLSVAIVTWEARELLEASLRSTYRNAAGIDLEIIVVDNASSDGSASMVESHFPNVRLIVNSENKFFARANNQAIRESQGRHVLLLNVDTVVLPGALLALVSFLDTHPEVGMVGAQLLNTDRSLQVTCNRFPTVAFGLFEVLAINQHWPHNPVRRRHIYADWDRQTAQSVDAVSGACMMARSSAIEEVGFLDERFLMYYEEDDWCFRFRKAGWPIYYYPGARVIHHGGHALERWAAGLSDRLYWDSLLKFYEKHYSRAVKTMLAALLCLRRTFSRANNPAQHKPPHEIAL